MKFILVLTLLSLLYQDSFMILDKFVQFEFDK